MLLAQVDPTPAVPIAEGLAKNPLAWTTLGLALAVAYLFRTLIALYSKHIETVRADAKDSRDLLAQIVPLSAKLTEGIEVIERITERLSRGP